MFQNDMHEAALAADPVLAGWAPTKLSIFLRTEYMRTDLFVCSITTCSSLPDYSHPLMIGGTSSITQPGSPLHRGCTTSWSSSSTSTSGLVARRGIKYDD